MTWTNVKLILMREVRDQLRDRRMLFMVLVLPVLLYPGLGIGMFQMSLYFSEQPRVVVLLGADELPELPLLEEGRIASKWFHISDHSQRLVVVSDSEKTQDSISASVPGTANLKRGDLLAAARRVAELAQKRNTLGKQLAPHDSRIAVECSWVRPDKDKADPEKPADFDSLRTQYIAIKKSLSEEFIASKLQLVVVFPKNFNAFHQEVDRLLGEKDFGSERLKEVPLLHPLIVMNRASDKSDVAYRKMREAAGPLGARTPGGDCLRPICPRHYPIR